MKRTTPRPTGLGALIRRWWPDRNPLRRTADRAEVVVLGILVLVCLAGAPLAALAASHGVSAASAHAQRAQAGWRRVPAVLQNSAPQQAETRGQATLEPQVPARWKAPDGTRHTGVINAPGGTRAGSTVMVWTDSAGQPTGLPLQSVDVAARVAMAAALAVVVVAALAACAGLLAHRALDRRRLAAWDTRWSETGPQWTGQR